jgi:RNA polymerase sigma-70 factor (ECF subfamily)
MREGQDINLKTIEDVYKSSHKMLCNSVNKIVNNREAAEDIVQEVFIKLWRKRNELKVDTTLKGYVFKSSINAALNYLESHKVLPNHKELSPEISESFEEGTVQELEDKELELKIREAIDRLPARCKTIFILSRFEDMKYKEIAIQLNLSLKTIENQMGIALEKLRNDLKPYLSRQFLISLILFFN